MSPEEWKRLETGTAWTVIIAGLMLDSFALLEANFFISGLATGMFVGLLVMLIVNGIRNRFVEGDR